MISALRAESKTTSAGASVPTCVLTSSAVQVGWSSEICLVMSLGAGAEVSTAPPCIVQYYSASFESHA